MFEHEATRDARWLRKSQVVVVGAGAMGGLFGGLLAEGGLDVTLDRYRARAHVDAIASKGLAHRRLWRRPDHSRSRRRPTPALSRAPTSCFFQCKAFANEAAARKRRQHLFTGQHGGDLLPERARQRGGARARCSGAQNRARRPDRAGRPCRGARRGAQFRRPADHHRRDGGRPVGARHRRSPTPSPGTACRPRPAPTSSATNGRSCSAMSASAPSRPRPT